MEPNSHTDTTTVIELLAFSAGGQEFAIDIESTREIRSWATPSEMPNAPPCVLGVINLRGEVLPLMDLAARLGLSTPEINERSVIIVAEVDDTAMGFLVDAVSDIIAPTKDELRPPPESVTSRHDASVRALTTIGERLVRVLDLTTLFPKPVDTAPA